MNASILADAIRHHQSGDLIKAEAGYEAVLKTDPDNADAIHLLGVIRFQEGDLEAAREKVRYALSIRDSDALFHANLGRIERALGDARPAADAFRKSLALQPGQADILSDLAGSLVDLNRADEALEHAEAALRLVPDFAPAHFNKGMALEGLQRPEEAIQSLERAVREAPDFVEARFQLGRLRQAGGDLTAAERLYRHVLSKDHCHLEALCNLGNIEREDGRLEDAVVSYDKAIGMNGDVGEIHSNKGVALYEMGRNADAVRCFRRAVSLNPDDAEAHRNLSMALLQAGRFEEGWREAEWRWRTAHFAHIRRSWDKPQWMGEDVRGRTVLVHAEMGFGDTFQFCRYVPLLADLGARVVLEVPGPVRDVVKTLTGVADIVAPGDALPDYEYQIPMMSLPYAFGTTSETIPGKTPYLSAPSPGPEDWRARLQLDPDRKHVAVAWKGNADNARNAWRSPGLEPLLPLFELDHVQFFAIQKDDGLADLDLFGAGEKVTGLERGLKTFSDTAAVMQMMDLIVTPDTSVAHLSGALGRPTWVMLPHVAEWRWGREGSDCPWYPTARLFRQPVHFDWNSVVDDIARELTE